MQNISLTRFRHISNNQLQNTKVFGDRFSAIEYVIPENARYLEIGVGDGHYSQNIVDKIKLKSITFFDRFTQPDNRGLYDQFTHTSYIKEKFKEYNPQMIVGTSPRGLRSLLKEDPFDYIYLDASHDFDGVLGELHYAKKMLAPNGVIGINDYTYYSVADGDMYGVIDAVNIFLDENQDWEVIAYSFGHVGYSDLYIKRKVQY